MCIRVGMYTEVYVKVMVSDKDVSFRAYWWDNDQVIYDRPGIVNGCCFRDVGSNDYYYYERRYVRRYRRENDNKHKEVYNELA